MSTASEKISTIKLRRPRTPGTFTPTGATGTALSYGEPFVDAKNKKVYIGFDTASENNRVSDLCQPTGTSIGQDIANIGIERGTIVGRINETIPEYTANVEGNVGDRFHYENRVYEVKSPYTSGENTSFSAISSKVTDVGPFLVDGSRVSEVPLATTASTVTTNVGKYGVTGSVTGAAEIVDEPIELTTGLFYDYENKDNPVVNRAVQAQYSYQIGYPGMTTGVGSEIRPVYLSPSGRLTLCDPYSEANVHHADNADYATKIGTTGSHPAIGTVNNPVYVDTSGAIVPATPYSEATVQSLANSTGGKIGQYDIWSTNENGIFVRENSQNTNTVWKAKDAESAEKIATTAAIGATGQPVYVNASGEITPATEYENANVNAIVKHSASTGIANTGDKKGFYNIPRFRGEYEQSPSVPYEKSDVVTVAYGPTGAEGTASYIWNSIAQPTAGNVPGEDANWQLFAKASGKVLCGGSPPTSSTEAQVGQLYVVYA